MPLSPRFLLLMISIISLVTSLNYQIYKLDFNQYRQCRHQYNSYNSFRLNTHDLLTDIPLDAAKTRQLRNKLDTEFLNISIPAFVGYTTEPIVSILESIFMARLGTAEQAGMGISIAATYSVAKLYNDPLLKTTTSLVAGKSGSELSASVDTAIATAMFIGVVQSIVYGLFTEGILRIMGVSGLSDMRIPAIKYLRWRALGVPAATVLVTANGIFRGRGDTKTPLYYTSLGSAINLILDPILMFHFKMGISGAGLANALSQWITVLPLLYLLNKSIPFQIFGFESGFLKQALKSYVKSGGLIFIRTIAKISAYTVASSSAAKLGTVPMAAYALTYNLGITASQLSESLAIAAQALLARDYPFDSWKRKVSANHVIKRSLQSGLFVSLGLAMFILTNIEGILNQMTKSSDVKAAALAVMPAVLLAQIFKSISSSTGGILLGGLDWSWSTAGMMIASFLTVSLIHILPKTLNSIWISIGVFTISQVITALIRMNSNTGPWKGIKFDKWF